MNLTMRFSIACACLLLGACSHLLKPSAPTSENQGSSIAAGSTSSKQEKADFDLDKDTLYDLLVAEIAAQREQINITLVNYIHQARSTRDVAIIRRALNAAQYAKDAEAIQEMGLLWVEVEPDSVPAHQLLAFQYSIQQNFEDAIYHIDRVIELGGDARVDSLALGAQQLPNESREQLLALYRDLYKKHPQNYEIGYSIALTLRHLRRYDEALIELDPIVEKHESFEPAAVLKANILVSKGDLQAAESFTEKKYKRFPHNHALGRLYASILIDKKRLDEAEEVFADLMERYPQAPGLKLSHALVMLENNKVEPARLELEELAKSRLHINEANFYLGRIADRKEEVDAAIEYYSKVTDGIHFEPALERASYLLTQADRTDEAMENLENLREERPNIAQNLWILQYKLLNAINDEERAFETLNAALENFPTDEQLLYARAMTYEANGLLDKMETDLRAIIKNNPKHAIAINALGYTLADKTDRLQEALALITLALSLKPENPAILDSMGWVLYRLGETEDSLVFLVKAYQSYPDPEVAAHLGEVLFALDRPDEAKEIWLQAYNQAPDHKVLYPTLERLAPEWLEALKATNKETDVDPDAPENQDETAATTDEDS